MRLFLEEAEAYEAFGGGDDAFFGGAWCPAEEALGFCAGGVSDFAEFGDEEPHVRDEEGGEADEPVWEFSGGDALGGCAEVGSEDAAEFADGDGVAGDGEEALTVGGGVGHGAEVEVGYVADVDAAEGDAGAAGDGAVHEALHEQDGGGEVWTEGRAEDADGVDDGEFEAASFAGDEVPCGFFGDGFGLGVGGEVFVGEVGPAGLVEGCGLGRMAVGDGDQR